MAFVENKCEVCGTVIVGQYCTNCGTEYIERKNRCINEQCYNFDVGVSENHLYCLGCGKPTVNGLKQLNKKKS